MTDRHIRILRLVAHQAQRELDDHHSLDRIGDTESTGRREHLERAADQSARRRRGRTTAARRPVPDS